MKHQKGIFITFEGGEGAGKSTQSRLLEKAITESGYDTILTREPGGTEGAEAIRNLLVTGNADKWLPETELLLHMAARFDHLHRAILPELAKGKIVICDRFSDSTAAYQGYGHKLGRNFVESIRNIIIGNFTPDLTILLNVDNKTGLNRATSRGDDENRYEKIGNGFHNRVNNGFYEIALQDKERFVIVDASMGINEIHNIIVNNINTKLSLKIRGSV